ncbi:Extracellular calcium-sensing receptor [Bagarius yarrelli]|uniref:Extracellular calcium-sensing receptor n=1 Tax=Bagarius yarrelli TaxID=175774 RepID=A0A556TQN6_BAGYA|nr:Extracellular calcium-sensing receptor [Bagarius yarrelli]
MPVFYSLALLLSLLLPAIVSSEADCQLWQDLDSAVVHKDGQVILAAMFPIHSKGVEQELNFMSTPDKRKCQGGSVCQNRPVCGVSTTEKEQHRGMFIPEHPSCHRRLRIQPFYSCLKAAQYIQGPTAEVIHLGACVAFRVIIPKVPTQQQILDIVQTIKDSTARVFVTFATEEDMQPLMEEVLRQNVTGRLWVASEAWVTSTLMSHKYPFLSGTMGFAIRRANIPGLKDFLQSLRPFSNPYNPSAREFWEEVFQCSFNTSIPVGSMADQVQYNRTCTGEENIQDTETIYNDVSQLRVTYNLQKAVYAAAHALHNLLNCKTQESGTDKQPCPDIYSLQPWQVIRYLKEVNFTNEFGDTVNFDEYGDPAGSYDIVNWQHEQFTTVGRFDASLPPEQQLVLYQDSIMWPGGSKKIPVSVCSPSCQPGYRKAARKGEPICCYDCVPCAEGSISNSVDQPECALCPEDLWSNSLRDRCVDKQIEFLSYTEGFGMALAATSILGVVATLTIAVIFIRHRDTPLVRANNSELSFLLLISLSLCFLCALTFLGQPSRWACPLRRTAFGLTFALCLSCLLSKTLVVLMAFRATLPGNNAARWFRPPQQRFGVFLCSAIQCVICVTWLTTSPPYPVKNTWLYRDRIILECHLGSVVLFCCVLGYIGCMAAFCFILAFLARKLPDNFNEAKFITFSMLIFCAVWIAYIPAYVSSPGKFTVAVEIFAILASSFGVLLCIFAPKCYIIIFMPEKNTKKYLMSQKGGR